MIDRRRDDPDDAQGEVTQVAVRRRPRVAKLLLGAALGVMLAVIGAVVVAVAFYRDPLPALTDETLSAARARWDQAGPRSYSLEVQIFGRRPGVVQLKVRDGEPVEMTRDGRVPDQRRTWAAWTVPSQFDMLATELQGQRDPEKGYNAPAGSQVVLKADFDPRLGYPLHVRRQVLGTELNVEWRVTKFVAD
ncbi:MAG: DUF6174 domain-containing protein [Planctomycetia bacterium]|nr:DUF6174 domain-containing protein [Planctomycetia bacterium]